MPFLQINLNCTLSVQSSLKGHFISKMLYVHEIFLLILFEQGFLEKVTNAGSNLHTWQVNKYALLSMERWSDRAKNLIMDSMWLFSAS